jgi:hypothetical protein
MVVSYPDDDSCESKHVAITLLFLIQCHHMSLMDFVVSPSGCGWSVTDFWGWDAHEAQLLCPDEVDMNMEYQEEP